MISAVRPFRMLTVASLLAWIAVTGATALAGDWPLYRADAQRTGYTAESLPTNLSLQWTYQPTAKPQPAWSGRDTRMPFDTAFHPIIADGLVCFGSSADGKIYALDAATGAERWSFYTDSPVRLPPAANQGRILAVSDDGHLYCLAADDGHLLWKLRGGPSDSMLLGNQHMVSRWPARGGPAVADGVVYFAAGIWPSEGIYLYAVDIQTGKVLWCNAQSGGLEMPQPHGGAVAKSGISAQGNLVVSGDKLIVPTGRAVPAVFDRRDGRLLYFHLQEYRANGGSEIVAADSHFVNRGRIYRLYDGHQMDAHIGDEAVVVTPNWLVYSAGDDLAAVDRSNMWREEKATDRKGHEVTRSVWNQPAWTVACPQGPARPLAAAGRHVIACSNKHVMLVDTDSRQPVFTADVEGVPQSAAVASGRLVVATDRGNLYCFGPATDRPAADVSPKQAVKTADEPTLANAADEIVRQSGVSKGYCLDLGCGDGRLTLALARRTDLKIYAVDPSPENVAAARRRLEAAGLYGVQVTVHQAPLDATNYPDYFANLIVSQRSLSEPLSDGVKREARRIQRPFGGVACLGPQGSMDTSTRGPLQGAGMWTHQYCNAANTNCASDAIVRGPLRMLWFADLNFPMPSRHGRGPAPLCFEGRMFIEGIDGLKAVDAYNGTVLWQYAIPGTLRAYDQEHLMGTAGTGSNMCVGRHGLFIQCKGKCLRIDPADGKLLAEYAPPKQSDGRPGTWGAVFLVGDTLLGTLADTDHVVGWRWHAGDMSTQFTESRLVFALDASTGRQRWQYVPQHRVRNNSIAIGNDRVYLIDRPLAEFDRLTPTAAKRRGKPAPPQPTGTLVALNLTDGSTSWKQDDVFGTTLAFSQPHDVLVMSYQDTRYKLESEIGGQLAAFRASDGKKLWQRDKEPYRSRLIVNDRTIYAEPGAWDLLTGDRKDFQFSRSYGCGTLAGSTNLLLYRSATLGYTDLTGDQGTENYGGIRPGCWINAVPAGGLVLMPDATDGCTCSYLIKSSVALMPAVSD